MRKMRNMYDISLRPVGTFDKRKEVVIAIPKPNKTGNPIAWKLFEACTLFGKSKERGGPILTSNPNIQVLEIPSVDIPLYLKKGVCDLGICGTDMVAETGMDDILSNKAIYGPEWREIITKAISFLDKLVEIGKETRLCMVGGADWSTKYFELQASTNVRVGTSFMSITDAFLKNKGITAAEIVKIGGSIEQACLDEIIDIGVDQVETGKSLKEAKMGIIEEILSSQYCLWANKEAYDLKKEYIDKIVNMMKGVLSAQKTNILYGERDCSQIRDKQLMKFNVPPDNKRQIDEAILKKEIPCSESPTILPLVKSGWSAYEVLISTLNIMDTVSTLKSYGAKNIIWKGFDGYVE
ncbi:MAG: ATP phosphoribosyltransferase [Candidatus Micrarchaeota archaeon]